MSDLKKRLKKIWDTPSRYNIAQKKTIREFCREVFNRSETESVREALIEVMRELEIKL